MGIVAHRALDKLDPTAPLGEFIDQEHLMDIIACSPIGGGDEDAFNGCHGDAIAQAVETRPLESGAAVSLIAVDVLVGDMPIGVRGDSVTETAQLLLNRLVLLLTGRGDPSVQSDFHGCPPEDVMGQDGYLPRVPWSIAEGIGTPHPIVSHCHVGLPCCGTRARESS